jgi:betaine-aldehyde dehydrogenase
MTPDQYLHSALPRHRGLYYGGTWHEPRSESRTETLNASTGGSLGEVAVAGRADVDAAVAAAQRGFGEWRAVPPLVRARILRRIAEVVRQHADELALIDAANCGSPSAR